MNKNANYHKIIEDAWLGIDVDESTLFNPMDFVMREGEAEMLERLTWLMTQPDYFYFTCKYVLNVELSPFQCYILKELWERKFPMLVGARGMSKSFMLAVYAILRALIMPRRKIIVVGAAFRQSKVIFEYMETIWKNAPVLRDLCASRSGPRRDIDRCVMYINESTVTCLPMGDGCLAAGSLVTYNDRIGCIEDPKSQVWGNGKFRNIGYPHKNGKRPTKIIKTKMGFEYEATNNHKMKVCRNNEIIWVRSDEMHVGDRILIDKSERWHNGIGKHSCNDYYALGAMIGDGNYTNKYYLGFAARDSEIINTIKYSTLKEFNPTGDGIHWKLNKKKLVKMWLDKWGMSLTYTKDKCIPNEALKCSKYQMKFLLQGLFDTDGHVALKESRGVTGYVGFTNTSKVLVQQIQYILLHFGIVARIKCRNRNENWNTVYELFITGADIEKFKQIGFGIKRKQLILNSIPPRKNRDDIPVDKEYLYKIVKGKNHKYSKSNIKRRKSITSSLLNEIGAGLPEKYNIDTVYYDEIELISDGYCDTYDIHVPEDNEYCANGFFSHNTKIRGQRANDILADEFASIPRDIFENVVAGFASVAASPIDKIKQKAKEKKARELGIPISSSSEKGSMDKSNQIILSGTAYYDFNHFAEYWKKYHSIIESQGRPERLKEIFGDDIPKDFDWTEYSVIRVPVHKLPEGFMDEGQVARARATVHSGIYQMEYGAVFTTDSQGFFKRSLIEACTVSQTTPVTLPSGEVFFEAMLRGDPRKKYVFGVDPASEVDNFSIIVLEINPDHRRIVHCWTTTRKQHKDKLKKQLIDEDDFYSYCAKKIRELMKIFPCAEIAIDTQGGGIAIIEALQDSDKVPEGEVKIWPTIEEKEQETDFHSGLHILKLCNFAKADWCSESNHGLRKDFEDRMVLFPFFDSASIGLSIEEDKMLGRQYDTLEDCVMEIEELKDELAMIVLTLTPTGRERWDTPEVKTGIGKKDRLRKDRYSALVMANMSARNFQAEKNYEEVIGGFAEENASRFNYDKTMYHGPAWFTEKMNDIY